MTVSVLGALLVGYVLGGLCALGLMWRRLAREGHLRDELWELYCAGTETSVPTIEVNHYAAGTPHYSYTGSVEHMSAFNRRLASARELLDSIEQGDR